MNQEAIRTIRRCAIIVVRRNKVQVRVVDADDRVQPRTVRQTLGVHIDRDKVSGGNVRDPVPVVIAGGRTERSITDRPDGLDDAAAANDTATIQIHIARHGQVGSGCRRARTVVGVPTSSDQLLSVATDPVPTFVTSSVHVPLGFWPLKLANEPSGRKEPVKGAAAAAIDVLASSSSLVPVKFDPAASDVRE